jgi:hypothetical protein
MHGKIEKKFGQSRRADSNRVQQAIVAQMTLRSSVANIEGISDQEIIN